MAPIMFEVVMFSRRSLVRPIKRRTPTVSGAGSLAVTTDPKRFESTLVGLGYPSSKSALNMTTTQYAKLYRHMHINAVDPGSWTPPSCSSCVSSLELAKAKARLTAGV